MLTVMVTTNAVFCWSECFIISCTWEFAHFRTERMYLQANWHNKMPFISLIYQTVQ